MRANLDGAGADLVELDEEGGSESEVVGVRSLGRRRFRRGI